MPKLYLLRRNEASGILVTECLGRSNHNTVSLCMPTGSGFTYASGRRFRRIRALTSFSISFHPQMLCSMRHWFKRLNRSPLEDISISVLRCRRFRRCSQAYSGTNNYWIAIDLRTQLRRYIFDNRAFWRRFVFGSHSIFELKAGPPPFLWLLDRVLSYGPFCHQGETAFFKLHS